MPALAPNDPVLRRLLREPLADAATPTAGSHPDPDALVAHAANELSAEEAIAITRHLASCEDGPCAGIVRDAVIGATLCREALFGRRDEVTDPALGVAEHGVDHAFACPDALWTAFEAVARQDGVSVDGLLADAMRALLQERSIVTGRPGRVTVRDAGSSFRAGPASGVRERNTPTLQRSYLPRAPASTRRPMASSAASHLTVVMAGVRYEVTKERFVVGRGGPASDLAIDDPGVSRQHAVIEREAGGAYVLADMGSTNGVEYQGERIARKEIAHGDRFRIGDAELEFVFA